MQTLWEVFVFRFSRDGERVHDDARRGDVISTRLVSGFVSWLENYQSKENPSICGTCEHKFDNDREKPRTFVCAISADPEVKDCLLTAICDECSNKPDTELIKQMSNDYVKVLRADGFMEVAQAPEATKSVRRNPRLVN